MPKRQWNETQLTILKTLDNYKEKSRAYHKFKQAIKTSSTLKSYNFALDKFMIQSKIKSYDDTIKLKEDRIQDYLEDYVISLKDLSYNTANQYLSGVELFFDMNMKLLLLSLLGIIIVGLFPSILAVDNQICIDKVLK